MSLRAKLNGLEPGKCLIWVKGSPGAALITTPTAGLWFVAVRAFLKSQPQPNGTAMLVAEHAGHVRQYTKRAGGRLIGGNLHKTHTMGLRANYKPRPRPRPAPEDFVI